MLSVAQAVHHPAETPGAASKHSILGHTWSPERPNSLKRRKTESDCYIDEKKLNDNTVDILSHHIIFNSAEITLTPIPKNNPNIKELVGKKIILSPKIDKKQTDKHICKSNLEEQSSNRILSKVPPEYRSILENNEEIQLTTLDNKHKKIEHNVSSDKPIVSEKTGLNKQNHSNLANTEFAQATVGCSSNEPDNANSSACSSPKIKRSARTLSKLAKAQDFLKKKESSKAEADKSFARVTRDTELKPIKSNNNFAVSKCKRANSPIILDEFDDQVAQEFADYEPFNIGIPCETFYTNSKDRPYYTTGFPNPVGENRCWTNATLQALFALPILNDLDSLHFPECSKLMSSLINVQKSWRRGGTNRSAFDNIFGTFKEELSILDELYNSRAQQDVSEFVMNLLNFIETEFEAEIKKDSHQNEIENIPNNEQDPKPQTSLYEANKRLPLSDISAAAGQIKSRIVLNTQEGTREVRNVDDNDSEQSQNPIDEYFSLYMMEKYTCNCCSKQRSQKVENLMLFIDLPEQDEGITVNLIDMINKTFAQEQRSMTCETCKHDVHTMESKFKKLPKVLIVQVKRYEMTNEGILTKKSTSVEVPRLLKLDSLVINNCQDIEDSPEFEPMCIISHIGDSINSGHYISFVKHQDQWFYYDDINVSILSADEVFKNIQNNAYVIFFQDTKLERHTDLTNEQIEQIMC